MFVWLYQAYTPVIISLRWVCDGFIGIFDQGPTGLLTTAGSFLGNGRASSYFLLGLKPGAAFLIAI